MDFIGGAKTAVFASFFFDCVLRRKSYNKTYHLGNSYMIIFRGLSSVQPLQMFVLKLFSLTDL